MAAAAAAAITVRVLPATLVAAAVDAAAEAGENYLSSFAYWQGQPALGGVGELKILRDDFAAV